MKRHMILSLIFLSQLALAEKIEIEVDADVVEQKQETTVIQAAPAPAPTPTLSPQTDNLDSLLGEEQTTSSSNTSLSNIHSFFKDRAYISFGSGMVSYPQKNNIKSTGVWPLFFSFGGYGYDGNLIFDLMGYLSVHENQEPNFHFSVNADPCAEGYNETVSQPGLALSLKYSPLQGQIKPYLGVSGALTFRKAVCVKYEGNEKIVEDLVKKTNKDWYSSFDAGVALGGDLMFSKHFGLNLDIRYHVNIETETRTTDACLQARTTDVNTSCGSITEEPSLLISGSLRYYF